MKSKNVALVIALSFVGICSFSVYQVTCYFICLPGYVGDVYGTWETSNDYFKIRIVAQYEEGVFMPGAFYTVKSASIGSDDWREFKRWRGDDAVPLVNLTDRFGFISQRSAYFYTADDFLVTTDAGASWSVWKPYWPKLNGKKEMWGITSAHVRDGGTGEVKLWNYDGESDQILYLELYTKDYGRSWNATRVEDK